MEFYPANVTQFEQVKLFYWDLIDAMQHQTSATNWKKGIFPSNEFLMSSIQNKELYLLSENGKILASVILNNHANESYQDVAWGKVVDDKDVLIPHALGVNPAVQGKGISKIMVQSIIELARQTGKKAIRLDVFGSNYVAENLYKNQGFKFVESKQMLYDGTTKAEYHLYEMNL